MPLPAEGRERAGGATLGGGRPPTSFSYLTEEGPKATAMTSLRWTYPLSGSNLRGSTFPVLRSRFSSTASWVSPRYLLLWVSRLARPGAGWEPFAISISKTRVSFCSVSLRANSPLPAGLPKEI